VKRGARNTAHAFLQAPYGTYPTANGYLALAMTSVPELGVLIGLDSLAQYQDPQTWWTEQAAITRALADHLATRSTEHWLELLDAADVWCAPVLTLPELVEHEGFASMDMVQSIHRDAADGSGKVSIRTTRAPVRFDGAPLRQDAGAPRIGEHNDSIRREFLEKG